jgi:hypothetical protein
MQFILAELNCHSWVRDAVEDTITVRSSPWCRIKEAVRRRGATGLSEYLHLHHECANVMKTPLFEMRRSTCREEACMYVHRHMYSASVIQSVV